ncbi:MAG: NUDIX domain-containing protein [Eubacteriales bacterium]|nr:NUDIX domain-containing protein [Eubacteriales bacterium]
MTQVQFYQTVEDSRLSFAVIIAHHRRKWVFCKHFKRDTYEAPGGHREPGETIFQAAERELYEETGAIAYAIKRVCVYSVKNEAAEKESFGMLYSAEIFAFEPELRFEIENIELMESLPENWTYPDIQPKLLAKAMEADGMERSI